MIFDIENVVDEFREDLLVDMEGILVHILDKDRLKEENNINFDNLMEKIKWIYCPSEMTVGIKKTLEDITDIAFELDKIKWYSSDIFGKKMGKEIEVKLINIKKKLLFLYTIVESRRNSLNKKEYTKELESYKNKVNDKINNYEKEIQGLKKELSEQNKNLLVIMGIFLSIFSIISINLSFFSQFENNNLMSWLMLIIVVNVTLCGAIKFLLSCIKKILN